MRAVEPVRRVGVDPRDRVLDRRARARDARRRALLVRDDARRRLLFEMDASIQTLRHTGADDGAVLALTGIYHNLLRQWSET